MGSRLEGVLHRRPRNCLAWAWLALWKARMGCATDVFTVLEVGLQRAPPPPDPPPPAAPPPTPHARHGLQRESAGATLSPSLTRGSCVRCGAAAVRRLQERGG